jgi:prepilin-type N-terminal cleavage/methylation domain-containing protein
MIIFEHKKHNAFTLAEVLITLLIIGVVASLVIPNIINDSKEAEYNAGVKKAYADLSQALQLIQVNNGGSVNVGTAVAGGNQLLIRSEFCNVMTCIKQDRVNNIFSTEPCKYYKGGNSDFPSGGFSTQYAFATNNGYFLRILSYSDCTSYNLNVCASIRMDINGLKGPNMYGKDYYVFWISRQNGDGIYRILPSGIKGDSYAPLPSGCTSGSTTETTSMGCTAKRLIDPDHMP